MSAGPSGSSPRCRERPRTEVASGIPAPEAPAPGRQAREGRGPAGRRSRLSMLDAAESPGEIKVKGSGPAEEEAGPCLSIRGAGTGRKHAGAALRRGRHTPRELALETRSLELSAGAWSPGPWHRGSTRRCVWGEQVCSSSPGPRKPLSPPWPGPPWISGYQPGPVGRGR